MHQFITNKELSVMLSMLVDYFCSRPFPERPKLQGRVLAWVSALIWVGIAVLVGRMFAGNFAVPGENVHALVYFTGAFPSHSPSTPLLWWCAHHFTSSTMLGLNLFGSLIMGLTLGLTWLVVRFWTLDAMSDALEVRHPAIYSHLTSHLACAFILFSLPGMYAVSGFMTSLWGFMWLLICVVLQNRYAISGGRIWNMYIFAIVLGIGMVESYWVLLFSPVLFLRTLVLEWRLWDHSARNLPHWFIGLLVGVVGILVLNTHLFEGAITIKALWTTEKAVLATQVGLIRGLLPASGWIFVLILSVGWPILAFIMGRNLISNVRAPGAILVAPILTVMGLVTFWGGDYHLPTQIWFRMGQIPVATAWVTGVFCSLLIVGWAVQMLSGDPELDVGHSRKPYRVLKVLGWICFPVALVVMIALAGMQVSAFGQVDRSMQNRFAAETVQVLAADAEGPAANHPYLLTSTWNDPFLALEAQNLGVDVVLLSPARANDQPYLDSLKTRIENDPRFDRADVLRLTHLIDYNFDKMIQDFYFSQENVMDIAAVYSLADTWLVGARRPLPYGTLYLGLPDTSTDFDPLPAFQSVQNRWADTLTAVKAAEEADEENHELPWWDLNRGAVTLLRHHLGFMANNLGTYLDDQGRLAEAAECYYYALLTDDENISALLNLVDIVGRRGQLPDRSEEVKQLFENFLSEQKTSKRRYDLRGVGRVFGYIRNYDFFVQMGLEWALSGAPESVLAGLRNARDNLAPDDPNATGITTISSAVYELQGQSQRAYEGYQKTVTADPDNIDALRGLARLSIQRGQVQEAGQWLAKAEAAAEANVAAGGEAIDQLFLDRSAYLMAVGDFDGAARAIGEYTDKYKDNAVGWAMLGMLRIEQGNLNDARGFILENIKRTATGKDVYFLHVLQGRLAQATAADAISKANVSVAKQNWEVARMEYRRAYELRPNVRNLLELILEFDRNLNDDEAARAHAYEILEQDRANPLANFVVGTQLLNTGEIEAAAKHFRFAVEGSTHQQSPAVLNNYVDTLARTKDTAQACKLGLQLIQLAPDSYASYGTYAFALARNGEGEKAGVLLQRSKDRCAEQNNGTVDPRLEFTDIWIAIDAGDLTKARQIRDTLKVKLEHQLTPLDNYDFADIAKALGETAE